MTKVHNQPHNQPHKQPWIKQYLPKSLFGRALLIIMLPIALMQIIVAYIFFDAHWQTVTASLSDSAAADISVVVELYKQAPDGERLERLDQMIRPNMKLSVVYDAKDTLPTATRNAFFSSLDKTLRRALSANLQDEFWFDTTRYPHYIDIRVQVEAKVLKFVVPRDRVFAPTGFIFLLWLVMATLLLTLVSILFILNQARPIVKLARAAENFGKGRDIGKFKPSGATEVRQAGHAFLEMRDRIGRHIDQRTTLLAGVSHDLRTPLTRLKLHLALEGDSEETQAARRDITDMANMLDGYLDFARDTSEEDRQMTDVAEILREIVGTDSENVSLSTHGKLPINVRKTAMKRALSNLINNGIIYAKHVEITANQSENNIQRNIDDDGPGIPPSRRQDALKPFVRLDPARNQNTSGQSTNGVGLGLSIANDIIQAHGGTLVLEDSAMGGLRCVVVLPL
ncbi:MAG: ATP-binding protein [Robiginitomaculum sp.]|nr:ATP-binding protein [Robiginitomaculum sp.]